MIDKMIALSIERLESALKDIPVLKQEIEELKTQSIMLFEENRRLNKEITELEKEYKHSAFYELLSRSYRNQRKRIEELKKQVGNNLKERERISISISEKQERLDGLNERNIRKEIADFRDKQKAVHLLMERIPGNKSNSKFMADAVMINIENIAFDETDNNNVYLMFLHKLKEIEMFIQQHNDSYLSAIEYAIDKISSDSPNTSDHYNIPLRYLFEAIKYSIKGGEISHNFVLERYIKLYKEFDGLFSREYGKILEQMYDDPSIEVGIYGVKNNVEAKSLDEEVSNLFEEGIRIKDSEMEDEVPCICDIAKISHVNTFTFLDIISHVQNDCLGQVILQIPKTGIKSKKNSLRTTIWGLEENNDENNYYFLPKYMKGFLRYSKKAYTGRESFSQWRKYNKQVYDGSFGPNIEIRVIKDESHEK